MPEQLSASRRILVSPLDWGLGHATRCIPVIRELQALGCEVYIAADGAQKELLKAEFPDARFLPLPGYRVKYARHGKGMAWAMLRQWPAIRNAARNEHRWLSSAAREHRIQGIISDNRYGLQHPSIPSVFITHQLRIKSPWGRFTENILQQSAYRYISRFTQCWVPDTAGGDGLAGELSHPVKMPSIPVSYTGWLSRYPGRAESGDPRHLLFILSGPEPQRSILENIIIREVSLYPHTATIIRGLPASPGLIPSTNMIRFYNHCNAADLLEEVNRAGYIICRSGYSSMMDMAVLKKKCIFIPTPGQTEQEYLARHAKAIQMAPCFEQKQFRLAAALDEAGRFNYRFPETPAPGGLSAIVKNFVAGL